MGLESCRSSYASLCSADGVHCGHKQSWDAQHMVNFYTLYKTCQLSDGAVWLQCHDA